MSRKFFWLASALLAGCANIPHDRGLSEIKQAVAARGQTWPAATATERDAATHTLLAQPLQLSDAISIALLNNPRVDAAYGRLGLAGAEVLQAGRLSNPRLSAGLGLPLVDNAVNRFSFGLAGDFLQLLLLPARSRLARSDFETAKAEAGADVLELAADVAEAYYAYLTAEQSARLQSATAEAFNISADYAQALQQAGNLDQLSLLLRQASVAQTEAELLDAQARQAAARNRLNRTMGLRVDADSWQLAAALKLPVGHEDNATNLVALAYENRLDLQAAQTQLTRSHDAAGLSTISAIVGGDEIGASYQRDSDGIRSVGPELTLSLPLFDQGQAARLQARSRVELAQAQLATLRLDIGAQVRDAAERVDNSRRRVALIGEHLLPLRAAVVSATQQRVNYALLGVFESLAAKQQEYAAQQAYLSAIGDYWQARVALARAVGAKLPSDAQLADANTSFLSAIEPPSGASDAAPNPSATVSGAPR